MHTVYIYIYRYVLKRVLLIQGNVPHAGTFPQVSRDTTSQELEKEAAEAIPCVEDEGIICSIDITKVVVVNIFLFY